MDNIEPLMKSNVQATQPARLKRAFQASVERISSELIEGFQFFSDIQKLKAVAVFGSGAFLQDNPYYQKAQLLAKFLAREEFTVVTGGGPGVMEAANRGAFEGNGHSVGLNIRIPRGQNYNKYVKSGLTFNHFFVRKVMFAVACHAYVFFPGGFGTLDEFFEIINLIHNQKLKMPPVVVAIGKDYWQPLFTWLKNDVGGKYNAISEDDLNMIRLVDEPKEVMEVIQHSHYLEKHSLFKLT